MANNTQRLSYVQKQITGPVYQLSLEDFEDINVADWKIGVMREAY